MKLIDNQGRKLGSTYLNSNFLGKPSDIIERKASTWICFKTIEEAIEYRNNLLNQMKEVKEKNININHWHDEQEKNFKTLFNWVSRLNIN